MTDRAALYDDEYPVSEIQDYVDEFGWPEEWGEIIAGFDAYNRYVVMCALSAHSMGPDDCTGSDAREFIFDAYKWMDANM